MFGSDFEEGQYQDDIHELVKHYEQLVRNKDQVFFGEDSFEQLIEYYEERNNLEKAAEVADVAIQQYPFSATFYIKKAQLLFDMKQFDQALDLLDKAEIFDPTDISIFLLRSDIYVWLGQFKKAVKTVNYAISVSDKDEIADLSLELADIYEEWEKYDKVFESLKQALNHDPGNEEALNRMWFCVEFTEEYEESIRFHEAFIDENPYAHLAWFNLAHAYAGLKRYDDAVDAFEYVMAINEKYDYAYKDCGEILFKLKQYDKAAEYFQKAVSLSKPYKELFFSIGQCFERLNNHNRARYYYRKATSLDPYFFEAFFHIGLNYMHERRWSNAITSLERAWKLNENSDACAGALGKAFREVEDFEQAADYHLKAVELKPKHKKYWLELARTYFEWGTYREAINTLEEAEQQFVDAADVYYVKSAYYYQIGNKNESYVNLERALLQERSRFPIIFEIAPIMQEDPTVTNIIEQYAN